MWWVVGGCGGGGNVPQLELEVATSLSIVVFNTDYHIILRSVLRIFPWLRK